MTMPVWVQRVRWRRVARAIVPVCVASLILAVGLIAALADGYPTKDVDLHDGGVWVTKGNEGLAGRFLVPIEELDAVLAVSAPSVTELELLQDERQVFLNTGAGVLQRVDVVQVALAETGARIPVPAGIALGGGVVAVLDPADGRLWVRPAQIVDSLDTGSEPEDVAIGGDAAVTVGRDGVVHAVSGDTDRLVSVRLTDSGQARVSTTGLGADVTQPSITAVGDRPVVLSGDGRVVVPGTGERVLPGSPELVRLQQAGPASDVVAVVTETALYGVPLDGGDPELLSSDGTGGPAAPVQLGGCIYAAWSGQALLARVCRGAPPVPPVQLGGGGLTGERLEFRVNYDLVVLNGIDSGSVYTFERAGEELGNWENVQPPEPDDEQTDPNSNDPPPPNENTEPKAEDDEYGARPGHATLLPVLDNDGDADLDVLTITGFSPVGEGARLSVIANGQALQLDLPPTAQGTLLFRYTVSDGNTGTDDAGVTVHVRSDDQNGTPELVDHPRHAEVEVGGTVTFHVLTDWRDPDGDPLVLIGATIEAPNEVRSTPDGFITFTDGNLSSGTKTVRVRISDGRGDPIEGTVVVDVLPRSVYSPPKPRPDRVVAFVGDSVTIRPLENDVDVNITAHPDDTLRLAYVDTNVTGVRVIPNYDLGTVRVTADSVQTVYLTYRVTQGGDEAVASKIRVDVFPASARNAPVAVADTVILRGSTAGVVDVLVNDTDVNGDVLVVSSVEVPENSHLTVSVIDHRWLRVIAPQADGEASSFRYTVSDGFATDTGVVTVSRVDVPENQEPSTRDDTARVRAGDVVTIDVLANDVDPEGGLLTLGERIIPDDENRGEWYVTGGTVRFQAPATPGTVIAHYKVYDPERREANGRITVNILPADASSNQAPSPEDLEARVFTGTVTRIHIPLSGIDLDGDSVVLLGATRAPEMGRVVAQGIDYLDYEAYPGQAGTDHFTYLVRDPFGLQATGTVNVGIIPRPVENSAPVAVDDEYTVAPGATVRAPVLANDSDVDGDTLRLEPLEVPNPGIGGRARIEGGRIVVIAPTTPGEQVSVQYAVTDGRGLRSFATLRVVALPDANVLPTAEDDWVAWFPGGATSVDVPILTNDDDIDGDKSDLVVTPIVGPDGPGASWLGDVNMLRVELTDRPRQVAYQITDPAGGSAVAFVHVPAAGDQAPHLREGVEDISIVGGSQQEIDLTEYIEDPEGAAIRITATDQISASPQPGLTLVGGSATETSLTLQADPAYVGPASLVVEVTDGDLLSGRRAAVTINVTITPADGRRPTVSCPPVELRAGAPAIEVDLRRCVLGLTPLQRETLTFTDPQGGPGGVTHTRQGPDLSLSAGRDAAPDTAGVLRFTVGGPWGDIDAEMTVRVRAASLARANADVIPRAAAGQPATIDVTENDFNPFPGEPLRVTGAWPLGTPEVQVSVDEDGRTVRVLPAPDWHGVAYVQYTLQDVLNQPDRLVQGSLTVNVIARPDQPAPPREVSVGANRAVITWTAPEFNGAPIDRYEVQDVDGLVSITCEDTICELPGLENGRGYRFQVRAHNVVDWSEWSAPSTTITPDQRPGQPQAPLAQFGDGLITLTWTAPDNPGTPIHTYLIEQSPGDGGGPIPVYAPQTSLTVTGLTNGASYSFRIQALNDAPTPSEWSPWSAPEVPAGLPGTPTAPVAAGVTDGIGEQMTVQWVAPADNGAPITAYTLTVIRAGTAIGTQSLAGDMTSTTVDVENGVQYTFRVTATNKAGESPQSPESAPAIAHGRPGTITSFSVTDHDGSNLGFDRRVQFSLTAPADNGMAISEYHFDVNGDGATDYDSNSAATTGYVTGLTNGTDYNIRVSACNDMCGDWSAPSATVNPYGQPVAPAPAASANGQTQINFSWGTPSSNGRAITSLEIRIDSGSWMSRSVASGSYTGTGYAAGSTHTISIRVTDSTGWVSNTRTASATTDSPPATVSVTKGADYTGDPGQCGDPSCAYLNVSLTNFSPNTTYKLCYYDNYPGGQPTLNSTTNRTTNGSGSASYNGFFYGYQGYQVWVRVVAPSANCSDSGVESNHLTWTL